MKKENILLKDGDVISLSEAERLLMSSNTFKFEEFYTSLKSHLRINNDSIKSGWFREGVPCNFLSPGQGWRKGKIRMSVEFIPDEPIEKDNSTEQSIEKESIDTSLDNIRQQLASEN